MYQSVSLGKKIRWSNFLGSDPFYKCTLSRHTNYGDSQIMYLCLECFWNSMCLISMFRQTFNVIPPTCIWIMCAGYTGGLCWPWKAHHIGKPNTALSASEFCQILKFSSFFLYKVGDGLFHRLQLNGRPDNLFAMLCTQVWFASWLYWLLTLLLKHQSSIFLAQQ